MSTNDLFIIRHIAISESKWIHSLQVKCLEKCVQYNHTISIKDGSNLIILPVLFANFNEYRLISFNNF